MNTTTLTLWIVDDEPAMCQGVLRVLEDFSVVFDDLEETVNYRGASMESGEAFLEKLDAEPSPDLLLLDGKLPGKDGIEVLGLMGKKRQQIVTVMITAYATLANAVSATKLGAFDFLAKPFTPAELRHAITRATREIILTRRARRLEQEKRQVRFEFLSILAHELKAPLAALEGYVDVLRMAPAADCLDRMTARIGGMRKLIIDLLDLTAIESGRRQRNLQNENLAGLAEHVLVNHMQAARDAEITVLLTGSLSCLIQADRSEMEMLLGNLISNAIKYNVKGGSVTVDLAEQADSVVLKVSDTGIGIAPVDQAKLFGEFSRIKNSRTKGIEGSGLGLSIVNRIAGLYRTKVDLISEEGKGSSFAITFSRVLQSEEM